MMDGTFNANSGALQDLLNSDKFNLIKSKVLRKILTSWSAIIGDLEEDQQRQFDFGTHVYFPYLSQHVAVRNITKYLSLKELKRNSDLMLTPSEVHQTNYEQLLSQREFENLLNQRNLIGQVAFIEMKDIRDAILQILELVDES